MWLIEDVAIENGLDHIQNKSVVNIVDSIHDDTKCVDDNLACQTDYNKDMWHVVRNITSKFDEILYNQMQRRR